MDLITQKGNDFIIGMDLLNNIKTRSTGFNPFIQGEVVKLELIERTEKVDGVEYPIFSCGSGREINLHRLMTLTMDESVEVANPGTPEECIPLTGKTTHLLDFVKGNEGKLPKEITIARRLKAGSVPNYLLGDKGVVRKAAYEMLGIDTTLDHFPTIVMRKAGSDPSLKENWNMIERVTLQVVN